MARIGLRQHRKFRRLQRLLQLPEPYVLGLLECIWSVTYENGDAYLGDTVDVEAAACWPGKPGELVIALMECGGADANGFIEHATGNPDAFQVHDLWDHAPNYVKRRARAEDERRAEGSSISAVRRSAALRRWNKLDANGDAIASGDMQTDATPPRSPEVPRVKREEGEGGSGGGSAATPAGGFQLEPGVAPAKRPKKPPEPLSEFTLTLSDGSLWKVPESCLVPFDAKLPIEVVNAEMGKLQRRTASDGTQRPTKRGASAKVANWLENAIKFRSRDNANERGLHA